MHDRTRALHKKYHVQINITYRHPVRCKLDPETNIRQGQFTNWGQDRYHEYETERENVKPSTRDPKDNFKVRLGVYLQGHQGIWEQREKGRGKETVSSKEKDEMRNGRGKAEAGCGWGWRVTKGDGGEVVATGLWKGIGWKMRGYTKDDICLMIRRTKDGRRGDADDEKGWPRTTSNRDFKGHRRYRSYEGQLPYDGWSTKKQLSTAGLRDSSRPYRNRELHNHNPTRLSLPPISLYSQLTRHDHL